METKLVDALHGKFRVPVLDRYLGPCLDLYGEFSEDEVDLFASFVEPGTVVLDIGANIGAHTVALAQLVGEKGTVIAAEPQEAMYDLLVDNVDVNGLDERCRLLRMAFGARRGRCLMPPINYDVSGSFGSMSLLDLKPEPDWPSCAVETVDHLLRDFGRTSFWKLDVEGMERGVMRGGANRIAADRPVIYFENDRRAESAKTLEVILGYGYRCFWHFPRLVRGAESFRVPEAPNAELEAITSQNVLALPREVWNCDLPYEIKDPSSWWEDLRPAQPAAQP